MANKLNRQIQRGEVVIMSGEFYKGDTPADRAFVCEAGFGLDSFTRRITKFEQVPLLEPQ